MSTTNARVVASLLDKIDALTARKARLEAEAGRLINFPELVSACVDLSEQAGKLIRRIWWSGELDMVDKGGGVQIEGGAKAEDLQTLADRMAEELIVSSLRKEFGTQVSDFANDACAALTRGSRCS
jgi:hypothetical protein